MIYTVERVGATRLADRLIAEFGTSSSALSASPDRLNRALPNATHVVELLLAARHLLLHSLGQEIQERPILADDRAVQQYLFAHMAYMPVEQARILHLDAKNRLMRDDVVAYGTVDRVSLTPRELVRQALDIGATGMILAHNHPSGDSTPSNSDMVITRAIFEAAKLFDIRLLDHIIVSRSGFYSFRAKGHL
ncbi:JAB domain-containing protein [Rhizorhabdus argentea]|uniref:JAB domain-containing protein n=1 Tax=Rhizorhabdus argentea TaxID=1387174 RepID=UPI0030ED9861